MTDEQLVDFLGKKLLNAGFKNGGGGRRLEDQRVGRRFYEYGSPTVHDRPRNLSPHRSSSTGPVSRYMKSYN